MQPLPTCRRGTKRKLVCRGTPLPYGCHALLADVPGTLLHCGANELADQRQELLCVPRMKLLQQGEQSQDQRWPVHGVGRFSADHSCKEPQTTSYTSGRGLVSGDVHSVGPLLNGSMSGPHFGRNNHPELHFELDPGLVEAACGLKDRWTNLE